MKLYLLLVATSFLAGVVPVETYANHNAAISMVLVPIKGTVLDSEGKPLQGVTVSIKEKPHSTVTNNDGSFTIDANVGDVVEFSHVGYITQQIVVEPNGVYNISMVREAETLSDLVVVGYSTKKKSEISSAVSYVQGEKLRDVTSTDLGSLIQGKVPGLVSSSASGDPTAANSIVIRGTGTINASSAPLVVVDGNIGGTYNPQDVESITVLRDASATGLYGSRAANGVIIVTTKSGKAGKTVINVNPVVGFSKASLGNFRVMNSQELYDYQKLFTTVDPSALNNNTDWVGLALRTAKINNHSVSASGGTEKNQFYVAGNYYSEEGTIVDNNTKKYNLRANLNSKLSEKLKLTTAFNTRYIEDRYNNPLYGAFLNMPYDPAYNIDGSPVDARYGSWFGRDRSNFLYDMQYNYSKANSTNVAVDVNLDYNLLKDLTLSTYNRATFNFYRSSSYYDKRSKAGTTNNGEAYKGSSFSKTLLSSNRLRYARNFDLHSLSAIGVVEVERFYYENENASVFNLPPGRDAFSTGTENPNLPSGGYDNSLFSKMLAQADYSYAGKYFAVASVVNEYSSRFGKNNPAATFFQLGASWILSKENFMANLQSISNLKLRASYGTTGNAEGIGYYASMGLYSLSVSYSGLPGAAPSQKANPNLTWEKAAMANLGVDIGIINRINLSIDAYDKKTSDLLFFRPLPTTSGYAGIYENVGKVQNRGIEFVLNTINVETGDFKWETSLNMSFNKNKILELNDGRMEVNAGGSQPRGLNRDMYEWSLPIWAGVNPDNGDPLWESIVKDAAGKEYVTYTNNYNLATRQYTGKSAAPKFTGGLLNDLKYKNFTLSAFLNFVKGNSIYHSTRYYFDNDGVYDTYNQMVLADGWSRWEKPGDIATHPLPKLGGNRQAHQSSTRYLEDGSFMRLRNVTLGYELPAAIISKMKLKGIRVYISGDNLATWTRFSGADPEVNLSSGNSSFIYPPGKKVLFGLNINF
ncbi:MAG: SusC/RagA family TonB-linked outer membrane protein [Niabella sp.]